MRNKEVKKLANKQKIRIRLRAYDHELIDSSAQQIVESAKRTGAEVSGPIPLTNRKGNHYNLKSCSQIQR